MIYQSVFKSIICISIGKVLKIPGLVTRALEYLTTLFNYSINTEQLFWDCSFEFERYSKLERFATPLFI